MKRAKVISIINEKGGVGKTYVTTQMALTLSSLGKKVLVVDNDTQADSTSSLTGNKIPPSITNAYRPDGVSSTVNLYQDGLPQVPYEISENLFLFGAHEQLSSIKGEDAIWAFSDSINRLAADFDFILIDGSPLFNEMSSAVLKASDGVLIPCLADMFSYKGAVKVLTRIKIAQKREQKPPQIIGVFISKLKKPLPNLVKSILAKMQSDFGNMMMMDGEQPFSLGDSVRHMEAMAFGQSITDMPAVKSSAAVDVANLTNQVIGRLNNIEDLNNKYRDFSNSMGRSY